MHIKDIDYTNTAARFWPHLIDDINTSYPGHTSAELSAPLYSRLNPGLLHPSLSLQKDIDNLLTTDLQPAIASTLAEMELLGPPAPVQIRVMEADKELLNSILPRTRIDSEIFPNLVVWLLKWAEIPEPTWNNPELQGHFTATSLSSNHTYTFNFTLINTELSENLRQLTLRLH